MRLLIITALYPPAIGGAAVYFGDIVPELARRKEIEQIIVLTERMPGQPVRYAEGKLEVLRYLPTRVSLHQRHWLIHAVTYMLTQLWFAKNLPALAQRYRVDLIHFHTRYRGHLFYTALRRAYAPVIADLRDKMADPAQLAGVADWLLCCSESVYRFAVQGGFPAERISLIPIPFTVPEAPSPNAVAEVRQRYELSEAPYVLFVGDITYNKGVYELLEAYEQWRPKHPDVRLAFIGLNREGRRFLHRLEDTQGAIYLGRLPHLETLALMRGAEILVLPSRSEGLPRVILEAVALGTKVICPPGIPEFERHLRRFVLPEVNVDAIVGMLETVWRYEALPSYPFSEHEVRPIASKIIEVYGKVCGSVTPIAQ